MESNKETKLLIFLIRGDGTGTICAISEVAREREGKGSVEGGKICYADGQSCKNGEEERYGKNVYKRGFPLTRRMPDENSYENYCSC